MPPSPSSGPPLLSGSASPPFPWGTPGTGFAAAFAGVCWFGVVDAPELAGGAAVFDAGAWLACPAGVAEPPDADPQPATTAARATARSPRRVGTSFRG